MIQDLRSIIEAQAVAAAREVADNLSINQQPLYLVKEIVVGIYG